MRSASKTAVIVGHDWGAPVAWHAALMRPDRFRAVIGLGVPYRPRAKPAPTTVMPRTNEAMFYQLYFQQPGVAEADLEADVRASVRGNVLQVAGEAAVAERLRDGALDGGMRARNPAEQGAAAGLADRSGRRFLCSGIRSYRVSRWIELVSKRRPKLGASGAVCWGEGDGAGLIVAGERDLVLAFPGSGRLVSNLATFVPRLRETIMLRGAGIGPSRNGLSK